MRSKLPRHPCAHRIEHPGVLHPVTPAHLSRELSGLLDRLSPGDRALAGFKELLIASTVDDAHRKDPRRYAEYGPRTGTIYVSRFILYLSRRHRIGLLAHELGHAWHGVIHHNEDDADRIALTMYGIAIDYDHRWPGKGLQRGRDLWR